MAEVIHNKSQSTRQLHRAGTGRSREPTLATLGGLGRLGRLDGRDLAAGGGVRLTPVTLTILGLVGVVLSQESLPVPERCGINDRLD